MRWNQRIRPVAASSASALLGEKLSAEQAAAWGLIWRCVANGSGGERVFECQQRKRKGGGEGGEEKAESRE